MVGNLSADYIAILFIQTGFFNAELFPLLKKFVEAALLSIERRSGPSVIKEDLDGNTSGVKHYLSWMCPMIPTPFNFNLNRTHKWNMRSILFSKSRYNKLRFIYNEMNKRFPFIKCKFLFLGYTLLRLYNNITYDSDYNKVHIRSASLTGMQWTSMSLPDGSLFKHSSSFNMTPNI